MIAMRPVLSTSARALAALLLVSLLASGCSTHLAPPGPTIMQPRETADAFIMPDGSRLPYRTWLPGGDPWAVVLALHGMNDSRDAWEYSAPDFANAQISVLLGGLGIALPTSSVIASAIVCGLGTMQP
jgi:DNA-binding transcriptional LysR family regulator